MGCQPSSTGGQAAAAPGGGQDQRESKPDEPQQGDPKPGAVVPWDEVAEGVALACFNELCQPDPALSCFEDLLRLLSDTTQAFSELHGVPELRVLLDVYQSERGAG